jgi:hypothetical protein
MPSALFAALGHLASEQGWEGEEDVIVALEALPPPLFTSHHVDMMRVTVQKLEWLDRVFDPLLSRRMVR